MNKKIYPHTIYTYKGLHRILLYLIFTFLLTQKAKTQQFNNWYFPLQNGITFNTNPPSFLAGSQLGTTQFAPFAAATISDNNGNLIFSSDGIKVWDKNNNQMPNGFGLLGRNALLNGVLIVPFISNKDKYYLFTAEGFITANTK